LPVYPNEEEEINQLVKSPIAHWSNKLPGHGGIYNVSNLNLYSYTIQNPIKYIDPDGLLGYYCGFCHASGKLRRLNERQVELERYSDVRLTTYTEFGWAERTFQPGMDNAIFNDENKIEGFKARNSGDSEFFYDSQGNMLGRRIVGIGSTGDELLMLGILQGLKVLATAGIKSALPNLARGGNIKSLLNTAEKIPDRIKQFTKKGGFEQAKKDFDALTKGVKVKEHEGGVRSATLKSGERVSVRPHSTDSRPTLDIRSPKSNRPTKIRYDD